VRRPRASSAHADLLAAEGTVIELSWYGDTRFVSRWEAFHARRLAIRSSQVGTLRSHRAGRSPNVWRWPRALRDPPSTPAHGQSRFDNCPTMASLAAGTLPALCHTIIYGEG
jgi:hypothetical protein